MRASAPGKLILSGEYAVLEGAPAIVVAIDRRAIAEVGARTLPSPFLDAVAVELAERGYPEAARRAAELAADSSALYAGDGKLGLGSSAAVTVAATALALELGDADVGTASIAAATTDAVGASAVLSGVATAPVEALDRVLVYEVAAAAHARAQAQKGARGSGADIAAAVHGGVIELIQGRTAKLAWPAGVALVPFFTGASADTATLVARVMAGRPVPAAPGALPRVTDAGALDHALATIAMRSFSAVDALVHGSVAAVVRAFADCADAFDELAAATGLPLVPPCVRAARAAMAAFGGTAKTTGAGGGDVGVAIVAAAANQVEVRAAIAATGAQILDLAIDRDGVRIE